MTTTLPHPASSEINAFAASLGLTAAEMPVAVDVANAMRTAGTMRLAVHHAGRSVADERVDKVLDCAAALLPKALTLTGGGK